MSGQSIFNIIHFKTSLLKVSDVQKLLKGKDRQPRLPLIRGYLLG